MGQIRVGLTPKQGKILEFVDNFTNQKSYPPSIREIAKECSISSTSVADYNLNILERLGYLRRHRQISRGIELVNRQTLKLNLVNVPIIGLIAAGEPIPVFEAVPETNLGDFETVDVDRLLLGRNSDVFALKVKGYSMIDALVNDGDLIVLRKQEKVENGQMAAVWLLSEKTTTLKKVYIEGRKVRLQPANNLLTPQYLDPSEVKIQGRVIAILRKMN
jgi:repressor LexA